MFYLNILCSILGYVSSYRTGEYLAFDKGGDAQLPDTEDTGEGFKFDDTVGEDVYFNENGNDSDGLIARFGGDKRGIFHCNFY